MPESNHSIENEPHLQSGGWECDPSEPKAAARIDEATRHENIDDVIDQSVWCEPAVSQEVTGSPPEDAITYAYWLTWRISQSSHLKSWSLVLGWALLAGPLAILGVLIGSISFPPTLLPIRIVIVGPVAEELMKVAIPLWVVERRPYLFRSRLQIIACAIAGGLVFAAVENAIYLRMDLFNWDNLLTRWRWTVCVALHSLCCVVSALGLSRIWKKTIDEKTMPAIQSGVPYFTTAIFIHGSYNAFAIAFEWVYEPF